jgi:hypothetical protein
MLMRAIGTSSFSKAAVDFASRRATHKVHPVYFHSLLIVMSLAFDPATETLPDAAVSALEGFPLANPTLSARQGAVQCYNKFRLEARALIAKHLSPDAATTLIKCFSHSAVKQQIQVWLAFVAKGLVVVPCNAGPGTGKSYFLVLKNICFAFACHLFHDNYGRAPAALVLGMASDNSAVEGLAKTTEDFLGGTVLAKYFLHIQSPRFQVGLLDDALRTTAFTKLTRLPKDARDLKTFSSRKDIAVIYCTVSMALVGQATITALAN